MQLGANSATEEQPKRAHISRSTGRPESVQQPIESQDGPLHFSQNRRPRPPPPAPRSLSSEKCWAPGGPRTFSSERERGARNFPAPGAGNFSQRGLETFPGTTGNSNGDHWKLSPRRTETRTRNVFNYEPKCPTTAIGNNSEITSAKPLLPKAAC